MKQRRRVERLFIIRGLVIAIMLALAACGGGGSSSSGSSATISGVAAAGAPIAGTVTLRDSGASMAEKSISIGTDGSFSFDVSGLTPPFILAAQGTAGGKNVTVYSAATGAGTANINPLTNIAVANATGVGDPATAFANPNAYKTSITDTALAQAISNVMTMLKPLTDGVSGASSVNPLTGAYTANHQGIDQVLDIVSISISNGTVTIKNQKDNSTITTVKTNLSNMTTATAALSTAIVQNTLPIAGTRAYAGTQSPGDYWTWTKTTDSSGSANFTAVNTTRNRSYSGSETPLTGNSAGLSKLTITSSTDSKVTLPTTAYKIEVPGTMVMAAVPPFATVSQPDSKMVSEHGPVVAAAQGSCPANGTTTDVNWILMPPFDWCPANNTPHMPPLNTNCGAADNAYGTAQIIVDAGGAYTINVTTYHLDGTAGSAVALSSCTCSAGVIQCKDPSNNPIRVAFTPSGIFIMDTKNYGVAGVVQSNITAANFTDLYANGKALRGMIFWAYDNPTNYPGGAGPETSPIFMTADGTKLTAKQYADIDAGTLSASSTPVFFNNANTVAPGLITTTFTNCDGSTTKMAMAITKTNGKYVAFTISYNPGGVGGCPDFTHGFNVLAVEQ